MNKIIAVILMIISWLSQSAFADNFNLSKPDCLKSSEFPLTVIDPSISNNPLGSTFPGYRASNQLVLYDHEYGKSRTGTNEFGFEVTVINGRIVDQEGSDSLIPAQNGFILSGHGKARQWLIDNAPIGAFIQINSDKNSIISFISAETYYYQLSKRLEELKDTVEPAIAKQAQEVLQNRQNLPENDAMLQVSQTLELLNQAAWKKYNIFPEDSIRGVWHRPVEKSSEAIRQTLDELEQAGINTVFLETFFHGYTIFPSQTYLKYELAEDQNPKFKGWDPLLIWIEEAHRRGIKVHVWFQSFYVGTETNHGPGPILKKYPQWANIQYSSINQSKLTPSSLEKGAYFADQANPEAQSFLLNIVEEIVTHYDIDGFQLDYMDYPLSFPPGRVSYLKTTWGYTPIARKKFQDKTGIDPINLTPQQEQLWQEWSAFKEEQVNQFVMLSSKLIRHIDPRVKISTTVFAKLAESKVKKHEDWALWADKGWIDFLAPMLLTSSIKMVGEDTRFVRTFSHNRVPVISGIFSPFNGNNPDIMMGQILEASNAGAQGFSLFDTAHLSKKHKSALHTAFRKGPPL